MKKPRKKIKIGKGKVSAIIVYSTDANKGYLLNKAHTKQKIKDQLVEVVEEQGKKLLKKYSK